MMYTPIFFSLGLISIANAFPSYVGRVEHAKMQFHHTTQTSPSFTSLNAWPPFNKGPSEEVVSVVDEPVDNELVPGPLGVKNGIAAAVWVSLVSWAFLFAPGALNSDADIALITKLISQPVPRPEDVNQIWFALWNFFAVVPAALAALSAPTGKGQRLNAVPFLWGSAFFGYFALGPYFATRTERTGPLGKSDLGWSSRNIFENRAFGVGLSALTISALYSSDIFVPDFDFTATLADFINLLSGSRFVSVASVDICLMSVLAAVLVSEDCKLRGWEDKSIPLLFGTILLPVLGPSIYLAVRPELDE